MQNSLFGRVVGAGLAMLCAAVIPAAPASRPSRKSPHVEIIGRGIVATSPRETVHKNGRKFLEFEITLSSVRPAADQPAGADTHLAIDTVGRVRVVHDLSCGGAPVALAQGDTVEIQGEYVHVPKDKDLVHFTHAADASCDSGSKHPGGFLRKIPATPRPSAIIPDQPFTGPPPPKSSRPYSAIVRARQAGTSNADLLAKVEREKVSYTLTTPEIQDLRAAGVSEAVIEAMLRAGRAPTPAATPR